MAAQPIRYHAQPTQENQGLLLCLPREWAPPALLSMMPASLCRALGLHSKLATWRFKQLPVGEGDDVDVPLAGRPVMRLELREPAEPADDCVTYVAFPAAPVDDALAACAQALAPPLVAGGHRVLIAHWPRSIEEDDADDIVDAVLAHVAEHHSGGGEVVAVGYGRGAIRVLRALARPSAKVHRGLAVSPPQDPRMQALLADVDRTALCLVADDDALVSEVVGTRTPANPHVLVARTQTGGHCGWCEGTGGPLPARLALVLSEDTGAEQGRRTG